MRIRRQAQLFKIRLPSEAGGPLPTRIEKVNSRQITANDCSVAARASILRRSNGFSLSIAVMRP